MPLVLSIAAHSQSLKGASLRLFRCVTTQRNNLITAQHGLGVILCGWHVIAFIVCPLMYVCNKFLWLVSASIRDNKDIPDFSSLLLIPPLCLFSPPPYLIASFSPLPSVSSGTPES